MCKMFNDWSSEIKNYCDNNGLNYDKALQMVKSCGKNFLFLQYHNPECGKSGLLDETPMPLVLRVTQTPEGLVFEQTENTKKYLS